MAVVVGLAIALPFGWLLSYAAALPYFLGLFFFVLFGIMIGAVMHRIASPRRPYRPVMLAVGTTIVVTVGWAASIVVEGRGFPADMAMKAGQVTRRITGDISAYRAAVAGEVRNFLRERYPPGGVMGYVRWILTSGDVKKGQLPSVAQTLRRRPCKGWWAVRAILSLGLFAFGVGSQTWPLKLATEPAVRAIDEVKKA